MEKKFIAKPMGIRKYHIFDNMTNKSLCGRVGILHPDISRCDEVTGNERYIEGQDCKACFKKAVSLGIINKTF